MYNLNHNQYKYVHYVSILANCCFKLDFLCRSYHMGRNDWHLISSMFFDTTDIICLCSLFAISTYMNYHIYG